MKKRERFIPTGFHQFRPELGDYPENMFACYVNFERNTAIFFTGKRTKHDWYERFNSVDKMRDKIKESIARIMKWEEMKAERKAQRKTELLDVKVGDLFVSSWGYEQTNVDFYQCVEVKGKTFTLAQIASRTVEDSMMSHGMACDVMPARDNFLDQERYPLIKKRSFNLNSYSYLRKTTDNEKHYKSWYA